MTNIGVQFVNAQETIRHNRATEALEAEKRDIERGQLDVARGQLEVNARSLDETVRHNIVTEGVQVGQLNVAVAAQALKEREFVEVTKPLAMSQIRLQSSQVQLNNAKAETEYYTQQNLVEQAALNKAKTKTEVAKSLTQEEIYYQTGLKTDYLTTYYSARSSPIYQAVTAVTDSIGGLVSSAVKAVF